VAVAVVALNTLVGLVHPAGLVVVGQKEAVLVLEHLDKDMLEVKVCITVVAVAVVLMKLGMLVQTKVMLHTVMVVMVNYHQLVVHLSEELVVVVLVESPHEVDMVGEVVVVMEADKHQVEPQQQILVVAAVGVMVPQQETADRAL
jgi:hypothetical protein